MSLLNRIPLSERIKEIARIKKEVNTEQNGTVVYITISGSDLYGFSSADSDVDYRGTYATGTHNLLGLRSPRDLIDMQPDVVMFELRKELLLALASNCNVVEHINSKPIYNHPEFFEMRRLVNNCLNKKGLYGSYNGLATHNYEKFISKGVKTYKKYLYIFRSLMAATYVFETGQIQPNMDELNKRYKLPEVRDALKAKRAGAEMDDVQEDIDSGSWDELVIKLMEKVNVAYEKSKMPTEPEEDDVAALNKWLLDFRRSIQK